MINKWLVNIVSNDKAEYELICFPPAGAGPNYYRFLHGLLPSCINCTAICLPGRESRINETYAVTFREVIKELLPILHGLKKKIILFGHSLGAILAYECAKLLEQQSINYLSTVILSGKQPPHYIDKDLKDINSLTDGEFIAYIKKYNIFTEELSSIPEVLDCFLPIIRADFTLINNYIHMTTQPLSVPLMILGGIQDKSIDIDKFEEWRSYTSKFCEIYLFQGEHDYLKRNQLQLKRLISSCIANQI